MGYKCRCSSRHPRSGGPHPAALRGAWGWRRAPGGGGWSCGLGPHPHCSRGWRGRWTGSPPTAPPAGPGHSALPPPGSAPRPTPPLAAPGLWETENGPQRRQEVAQRGGEGRKGRGGDRGQDALGCPQSCLVLSPTSKRTENSGGGTRWAVTAGCPSWVSSTAGRGSLGPRALALPCHAGHLSLLCPVFPPLVGSKQRPSRRQPCEDPIYLGAPLPWSVEEGFLEEVTFQVGLNGWSEKGTLMVGDGRSVGPGRSRPTGPTLCSAPLWATPPPAFRLAWAPPPPLPRLTLVRAPSEGQLAFALPVEPALQLRAARRAGDHVGLKPKSGVRALPRPPALPGPGEDPLMTSGGGTGHARSVGCKLRRRTRAETGTFHNLVCPRYH